MASRTSSRKRFSSASHIWPWRSALVRPWPMNSSPRAFSAVDDLRRVVEHRGVDQVRRRQVELVEQFEAAPHADPVAVVAPGEGARIGRRVGDGQQMPLARAEGEMLDVEAEIDREPLAARPGIILALGDRRIGIAVVVRQADRGLILAAVILSAARISGRESSCARSCVSARTTVAPATSAFIAGSGDGLGMEGALLGPASAAAAARRRSGRRCRGRAPASR